MKYAYLRGIDDEGDSLLFSESGLKPGHGEGVRPEELLLQALSL
jgi:hypothetical protein